MVGQQSGQARWPRVMLTYVIPPLAVFAIVVVAIDMPAEIAAARNEGVTGTATATRKDCSGRGACSYYGRFASDDGSIVYDDALIEGGVRAVGDTVEGQAIEGSRVDKVYLPGSHDWVWAAFIAIAAVAYLLGWLWWAVRPWLARRRGD